MSVEKTSKKINSTGSYPFQVSGGCNMASGI